MGLRPTELAEDAAGRSRRINNLDRVFRGAVLGWCHGYSITVLKRKHLQGGPPRSQESS